MVVGTAYRQRRAVNEYKKNKRMTEGHDMTKGDNLTKSRDKDE
jgi:hypothetical protein